MAGEIQLNSTSFASESGGTITINNATVGSAVAMSANQACVKTAINASGSAPIYACRAWINFDGTSGSIGTGRANGNVSGVSDNGTGDYTITFAAAMPDTNYCVTASTGGNCLGVSGHAPANGHTLATGSMRVTCGTPSANVDPSFVHFAVFR